MDNYELYHFGVKGMKWGVRRNRKGFASTQKPKMPYGTMDGDGWHTKGRGAPKYDLPSGKSTKVGDAFRRLDKLSKSGIKYNREMTADQKAKASMKKDVKNRRTLSDADLRKKLERIKMEKQLKELTQEELSPGRTFVKKVLSSSGQKVATTLATGAMLYGVKVAMEGKGINLKEAAGYMTPKPKK